MRPRPPKPPGGPTAAACATGDGGRRPGTGSDVVRTDLQQRSARIRLPFVRRISRSLRADPARHGERQRFLALRLRGHDRRRSAGLQRAGACDHAVGQGEESAVANTCFSGRRGGLPAASLHQETDRGALGRHPRIRQDRRNGDPRAELPRRIVRLHPPRETRPGAGCIVPRRAVVSSRNLQGRPPVLLRRGRNLPRSAARIGPFPPDIGCRQLAADHRYGAGGPRHESGDRRQRAGLRALGRRQLRRLPVHQQAGQHEVHPLPQENLAAGAGADPCHAGHAQHPGAHGLQLARDPFPGTAGHDAGSGDRRRSGHVPLPLYGQHARRSADL